MKSRSHAIRKLKNFAKQKRTVRERLLRKERIDSASSKPRRGSVRRN